MLKKYCHLECSPNHNIGSTRARCWTELLLSPIATKQWPFKQIAPSTLWSEMRRLPSACLPPKNTTKMSRVTKPIWPKAPKQTAYNCPTINIRKKKRPDGTATCSAIWLTTTTTTTTRTVWQKFYANAGPLNSSTIVKGPSVFGPFKGGYCG